MSAPDFKEQARELARETGCFEVVALEKAIRHGYSLCLTDTSAELSKALQKLVVNRMKNNLPQ